MTTHLETDTDMLHPMNLAPAVRLTRGCTGSDGGGCAMNALSIHNGDSKVTDYPESAARPLSRLVQIVNDASADESGALSESDSDTALLFAAATHGTATADSGVVFAWMAELLNNPQWGLTSAEVADDPRVGRVCKALAGCLRTRARGRIVSPLRKARVERLCHNLSGLPSPVKEVIGNARLVVRSEIGWAALFAAENAVSEALAATGISERSYTASAIATWRALAGPDLADPVSLHAMRRAAASLIAPGTTR